jgi:hypothetical protein
LGDAVAEGPVFLFALDEIDEHVLHSQPRIFLKQFRGAGKEGLFLLGSARVVGRDLNDDQIVAIGDTQITLSA